MSESLQTQAFAVRLLDWFATRKREMPWRGSQDPYHIWVSEIMLQQTRVETVMPYFTNFIERFPTVEALAEAPQADVLKAWEGLGYYSRARNLQAAAREVCATYGGKVPSTPAEIASLRGIGPYTAGAILSIAYNVPEPAVDGNVLRVMARWFGLYDDIAKAKTRVRIEQMLRPLIPAEAAGDFNQALMELGSLVCTPKSVKCHDCPVAVDCNARTRGIVHELPVKAKAKPVRHEYRFVAWLEGTGTRAGQLLLRQRAEEGLLAGLWELPHDDVGDFWHAGEHEQNAHMNRISHAWTGTSVQARGRLLEIEHVFSHIYWHLRVFRYAVDDVSENAVTFDSLPYRWVPFAELHQYTLPLVFTKIIRQGLML
jgi:A/G-specific adenine glycosylase